MDDLQTLVFFYVSRNPGLTLEEIVKHFALTGRGNIIELAVEQLVTDGKLDNETGKYEVK